MRLVRLVDHVVHIPGISEKNPLPHVCLQSYFMRGLKHRIRMPRKLRIRLSPHARVFILPKPIAAEEIYRGSWSQDSCEDQQPSVDRGPTLRFPHDGHQRGRFLPTVTKIWNLNKSGAAICRISNIPSSGTPGQAKFPLVGSNGTTLKPHRNFSKPVHKLEME